MVWNKPGASQADFSQARYSCMQQSQQPTSFAYVNQYGGSSSSGVATNGNLFNACMNAQGWSLQQPLSKEQQLAANEQGKAALDAVMDELHQLCARPDLQPYYSKTSCLPQETTLEQMADKSRANNSEKAALNKARSEIAQINKKTDDIIRQFNPPNAGAILARRGQAAADQDKLALDFYDGKITRGEYNSRRKEIAQKAMDDLANPGQHT
jgi:hypothetical protein